MIRKILIGLTSIAFALSLLACQSDTITSGTAPSSEIGPKVNEYDYDGYVYGFAYYGGSEQNGVYMELLANNGFGWDSYDDIYTTYDGADGAFFLDSEEIEEGWDTKVKGTYNGYSDESDIWQWDPEEVVLLDKDDFGIPIININP